MLKTENKRNTKSLNGLRTIGIVTDAVVSEAEKFGKKVTQKTIDSLMVNTCTVYDAVKAVVNKSDR